MENQFQLKLDMLSNIEAKIILNGILEAIGILNNNGIDQNLSDMVLRSIDKIDRLGLLGVKDLLGKGRRDDSGDFTSGANLDKAQIDHILQFINMKQDNNIKTLKNIKDLIGESVTGNQGIKEIEQILELSEAAGVFEDRIRVSPSTLEGLAIIWQCMK